MLKNVNLTMFTTFPVGSKVRFTQERLSILMPRDRQGLEGRIGVVQAHGHQARKPTVQFPADGKRAELRLFAVDQKHLEMVEGPPEAPADFAAAPALASAAASSQDDASNLFDSASDATPAGADAAPAKPADEGGGKLTQSEMDNLFD
jgi:hypothetical protein